MFSGVQELQFAGSDGLLGQDSYSEKENLFLQDLKARRWTEPRRVEIDLQKKHGQPAQRIKKISCEVLCIQAII